MKWSKREDVRKVWEKVAERETQQGRVGEGDVGFLRVCAGEELRSGDRYEQEEAGVDWVGSDHLFFSVR
jgi:hypothetical protein